MRFKLSVFSKSFYPNLFYLPYLNHIWSSFSLKNKIEFFGSKFFFIVSRWGRAKFRKFTKLEKLLEREDFFGLKYTKLSQAAQKALEYTVPVISVLEEIFSWVSCPGTKNPMRFVTYANIEFYCFLLTMAVI